MELHELHRRIAAFLHHPPERALAGWDDDAAKARAAEYLRRLLGGDYEDAEGQIVVADRAAAGANEYHFPGQRHAGDPAFGAAVFDWRSNPMVRHPLSGSICKFNERELPTVEEAGRLVSNALEALMREAGGGNGNEADRLRKLALLLWRKWPEAIGKSDAGKNLWNHLPVEPRIPDHSIWEHLSLTAALATAGIGIDARAGGPNELPGKAALLLFTIGPVQGFIGAANKTRDLEAGSFLVSYLTWQAIRVVCEACGPEAVLFPDLRRQRLVDCWLKEQGIALENPPETKAATIPNRFFAVVPDGEADVLAKEAEDAVRREFLNIADFALEQLLDSEASDQHWDAHKKLAEEYLECYWSILPLHQIRTGGPGTFVDAFKRIYAGYFDWDDARKNDILKAFEDHGPTPNTGAVYGRLYHLTDAVAGSRKGLRDFMAHDESGYRCSLIPSLPALTPPANGTPAPGAVGDFWKKWAGRTERSILRETEQLSLVALIKRYLPKYDQEKLPFKGVIPEGRFPSTGSFATADFKRDLILYLRKSDLESTAKREALRVKLSAFKQALSSLETALNGLDEEPITGLMNLASQPEHEWLAKLDGGWLFPEEYQAEAIAKEYGFEKKNGIFERKAQRFSIEQVEKARAVLEGLLEAAVEAGIDHPSKYYALLQMDGDGMGKWLSGDLAPGFRDVLHNDFIAAIRQGAANGQQSAFSDWKALIDGDYRRPLTPALHLAVSRALGTFALDLVPRLVEEQFLGRLVYSGGDDVLAFVSFRDALQLARHLRAAFSGQVHEAGPSGDRQKSPLDVDWEGAKTGYVLLDGSLSLTMGHTATASVGIVLVHYKHNLRHVFREAHHACEEYAKDVLGRDALGIAVLKRSGESFRAGAHWTAPKSESTDAAPDDLVEALERYAELIRRKLLATGYLYDIDRQRDSLLVFEGEVLRALRDQPAMTGEERKRREQEWKDNRALEPIELALRHSFRRHAQALIDPDEAQLPEWLIREAPRTSKDYRDAAFDGTVEVLLEHNPVDQVIKMIDAAQFIGQGGDR